MSNRVGFVLGSTFHPSMLVPVARAVEEHGFASIWSTEDYFATAGVAGAATVLAATEEIRVGTGVVSVYARHPGLLAMEAGTLASVHPGRFVLGIGVGGSWWLDQQGIEHRRPLGAVRGTVEALRALWAGETLTGDHGGFTFEGIHLEYPPPEPPPIHLGATGPKMTALAGEICDGLVLSVFSSPAFVRVERDIVAANGGADTPITTFAFLSVAETTAEARVRIRPLLGSFLADGESTAMTDAIGITEELRALARTGGPEGLAADMPDEWIDQLSVCGDVDTCAGQIQALLAAGSDEVALAPIHVESLLGDIKDLGTAIAAG
ncbi:LLM class flavin-dependent oxidoreductase [Jiangella ureilytica]|uniref:LLM class flavin-dependent oxidoreductase n=1 Tax=Jiangella ureilytica TaxID=2530374 RepID=A0A4R4RKG1_9ACTN|nr:LLM class flavin-dependent oxidoreductase [Jiangella ureilytica]TDC50000.1 LLM class flavin-dependent oxidoreductase [Jiangella ureilytica]